MQKIILILFIFLSSKLYAQLGPVGPFDTIKVAVYKTNDTLSFPIFFSETVAVNATVSKEKLAEINKKKERTERFVRETYCMAKKAAAIVREVRETKSKLKKRREKRQYVKSQEKRLKEEFTDQIKNMYIGKGKILVKLLHREVGSSAYDIIKEMKSGVNARFWQTMIFFYDGNLKKKYDPQGDDAALEQIVLEAEKTIICY